MGESINGITNSDSKQPEAKTGTGSTGNTDDRSTKATGTGTGTGTGAGTGTGSGTGTGTGTGTGSTKGKQTAKGNKVSVLTDLPEVNIPEPQETKTKTKRTYTKRAKKEENTSFDAKQISAFIVAVSAMVASREGCSHWLVTETEAEQIATPLANIIAKSEQLKSLGEHADAFALITACLMIFVPRLIVTLQNSKTKKGVKKVNGNHNDTKSTDSNKSVHRKDAVTPSNDGSPIFDTISAIQ